MRQKKQIFYIAFICLLMLMVLAGFYLLTDTDKNLEYAKQYSDLQVQVDLGEKTESIRIWQDAEEMYYFFLPSTADLTSIVFLNVSNDDTLLLNDSNVNDKELFREEAFQEILLEHTYDMQFILEGKELEPAKVQFVQSANLTTMFIDTESGGVDAIHSSKGVEEKADVVLINELGEIDYDRSIQYIRTRGNSTFYDFEKKAYQLKLYNDAALLGMAKSEKWILLANAIDDSLVRNALVYEFAEEYTCVPSIEGHFVDLYMNGNYLGNYYLCEKVEVDEQRLNITDLEAYNVGKNGAVKVNGAVTVQTIDGKMRACVGIVNPEDITGGYLVESILQSEYETVTSGFRTDGGHYFKIVSPKHASMEQVEYICTLFDEFEVAIATEDGINPDTGKHYSEYIDLESWIEKYLIDEVFHNPDSAIASLFFYKDSDSVDSHIFAGPVWDYDRALGSYGANKYELNDPLNIGNYGIYIPEIIQKYSDAKEVLTDKFQSIFVPYIENDLNKRVYELEQLLEASYKCNSIRWPQKHGYYSELKSNIEYIKGFMQEKKNTLQEIWLEDTLYHNVTFLDYEGNLFESYRVKHGECLDVYVPNPSCYAALFAGWTEKETGKSFDSRIAVMEDVIYESVWLDLKLFLLNGLQLADMDLSKVNVDELEALVEIIKEEKKKNELSP